MPMHPSHRLLQIAGNSLGHETGPVDGWWGTLTARGLTALHAEGPSRSTEWAVMTLQRGLRDLGYYTGKIDGDYGSLTRHALGFALDADGAPMATAADSAVVLTPDKPTLAAPAHDRVLYQGSARTPITMLMQHCAAVPGDWYRNKTNAEIVAAVHRMHTLPPSQGGRGWSDTGYHEIECPDGERIAARPLTRYGAGAIGYNRGVKHVLMIEVATITRTRHPEDHFTPETLSSMRTCIAELAAETRFERLLGHREVAAKLCPGHVVVDRDWTDLAVA